MEQDNTLIFIVILLVYTLLTGGYCIRNIYLSRKEGMRKHRNATMMSGKDVINSMLGEAGIDGIEMESEDKLISRYIYNARRNRIVVTTHSFYGSSYYDVVRAAAVGSLAVIHKERWSGSGIYFLLSPFMETWVRIMPLFFIIGLFVGNIMVDNGAASPVVAYGAPLMLYFVTVLVALLMRRTDRHAAKRGVDWLMEHGVVGMDDRDSIDSIASYVGNYNFVCAITGVFAAIGSRRAMIHSDVKV